MMGNAQWLLELALLILLAVTLVHAIRLERALGVLKRDRAVLEELVVGFNESTRQAETGIERLRSAAEGAGRQMARQIEVGQRLRDDLSFLADRSDKLAERLEMAVRSARMFGDGLAFAASPPVQAQAPAQMQAPVQMPAPVQAQTSAHTPAAYSQEQAPETATLPVLRSQAERELMRALRTAR